MLFFLTVNRAFFHGDTFELDLVAFDLNRVLFRVQLADRFEVRDLLQDVGGARWLIGGPPDADLGSGQIGRSHRPFGNVKAPDCGWIAVLVSRTDGKGCSSITCRFDFEPDIIRLWLLQGDDIRIGKALQSHQHLQALLAYHAPLVLQDRHAPAVIFLIDFARVIFLGENQALELQVFLQFQEQQITPLEEDFLPLARGLLRPEIVAAGSESVRNPLVVGAFLADFEAIIQPGRRRAVIGVFYPVAQVGPQSSYQKSSQLALVLFQIHLAGRGPGLVLNALKTIADILLFLGVGHLVKNQVQLDAGVLEFIRQELRYRIAALPELVIFCKFRILAVRKNDHRLEAGQMGGKIRLGLPHGAYQRSFGPRMEFLNLVHQFGFLFLLPRR